jgi:hypothetical protein
MLPDIGKHIFHVEFLSLLMENQSISTQFYTQLMDEVLHLQTTRQLGWAIPQYDVSALFLRLF